MPIYHSIWRVGQSPAPLPKKEIGSEALLENMIVAQPAILSPEWMIIGRQQETGHGGRIDLLALAPDGSVILIELKKGRTPREVVAQAIDYAAWAEKLDAQALAQIYGRFKPGGNLATDFQARFGQPLDEESLNQSHQIVIVAAELDASSERIVGYLNARDIPINVMCFQMFDSGEGQLLSRAWLLDPVDTQIAASSGSRKSETEPWNGEYYVSFGSPQHRNWEEARRFGFISGGGGPWYSGTLNLLKEGDRVWVRIPGKGYVGVGKVTGPPVRARDFELPGPDGQMMPALEVLNGASYHREHVDDPEKSEYFVPVQWAVTVPEERAIDEPGFFGNQNTVCAPKAPKWRHTIERLKLAFPDFDKVG